MSQQEPTCGTERESEVRVENTEGRIMSVEHRSSLRSSGGARSDDVSVAGRGRMSQVESAQALDVHVEGYGELLRASARRWPDRVALHFNSEVWTYGQLDALVDQAAVTYREFGVGLGDRVLLLMSNRPEYLLAQCAVSRLGAAFTTPNPHWTVTELERAVAAVAPTASIAEDRFDALLGAIVKLPLPSMLAPSQEIRLEPVVMDPDAEAYLPFTSGTSGTPKAVIHSAGSLHAGVQQLIRHLALSEADRLQLALPLCHLFGAVMTGASIAVGAEMTLFEKFELKACLDHLEQGQVTVFPIAGTVAYQLAELEDLEQRDWSSLRMFMWGGSGVPRTLAEKIIERTGVGFLCSYGMTEAISVAFNPVDRQDEWSLESPGYPTSGMQWRLAGGRLAGSDAHGDRTVGELEVRGVSVAKGYANAPNDGWLGDGWFRTGDLVQILPNGRIQIVDRRNDMLKVSGFQVSPVEVEQTLLAHAQVRDCAVFGERDPRTGDAVVAVVVPAGTEVSVPALELWAAERLARYKRPHRYILAEAIPRSPSGKLLRRELSGCYGTNEDGTSKVKQPYIGRQIFLSRSEHA